MIRIFKIKGKPVHEIIYEYPGRGGKAAHAGFPVYRAFGNGFPAGLDALVVTSDLQGLEPTWASPGMKQRRLLGEVVAEELVILQELGEIPQKGNVGVLLAGDLFVAQDLGKRGGKGDVLDIWLAFRDGFSWVSGVAGNHDRFGVNETPSENFQSEPGIHYLDATVVNVSGIRIGGVGGIIGNPSRPFRRKESDFLSAIKDIASQGPDIIILHEGPSGQAANRCGNNAVLNLLEQLPPTLVVCGHCQWPGHEFEELKNGTQVLNVHARAYIIERNDEANLVTWTDIPTPCA